VIGYKLLSGSGPYPDAKNAQIISEKLKSPPKPLAELLPGVDPDLASVLEQCLARKPEHRPTAAAVAARLQPASADAPDASRRSSGPKSPTDIFLDELKRRRVYRVAVGYLAFLIASMSLLDDALAPLGLSEAGQQLAIVVVLAGFPLTLVLAWMFDVRSGRIERTTDTPIEGGPRLSRVLPMIALVGSLVLAGLGVWWVL
jgi:hypothetical protein